MAYHGAGRFGGKTHHRSGQPVDAMVTVEGPSNITVSPRPQSHCSGPASMLTVGHFRVRYACLRAGRGARGFDPAELRGQVKGLSDNATFSSNNGDLRSSLGQAALISITHAGGGSIDIILCTSRNQVVNPDVWVGFGLDPRDFDILVVKSTNHFYGGFSPGR